MELRKQSLVVHVIWAILAAEVAAALLTARWSMAFIALGTLLASVLPAMVIERFRLNLPVSYVAIITVFTFATLFLGEAFNFYERYWWWDLALHGLSTVVLGMTGFLFVFYLFEGDRYAAPPWALSLIAFCLAMTVATLWEIFEFGMDQMFGLNMQKSGLVDTMSDLMIGVLGASLGAATGFLYLKEREPGGMTAIIRDFVAQNRRFFRKRRR